MYQFVTGPLAWVAFAVFFIGSFFRIFRYIRKLDGQADPVAYAGNAANGLKGALRSLFYRFVSLETRGWRYYQGAAVLVFGFTISLLLTPIFLLSHNVLLQERWGFSLWSLPESLSNILTLWVVVSGLFLALRRIADPRVRILAAAHDYLLMIIAVAPFVTGLMAYHQIADYNSWLIAHVLSGEVWLIALPLTKPPHFFLFFMFRARTGMDSGLP